MPPKTKNNGVATIDVPVSESQPFLRINFDDIDSIAEIEPVESDPVKKDALPSEPDVDSEQNVLATVLTFETVYAADPLKDKWLAWGSRIKRETDSASKAIQNYGYAAELMDLCRQEHNLTPNSYDRADMIKKGETVLSLCQVNDSGLKIQELVQLYWLVRLDLSEPGEPGVPRSFKIDALPDEYFAGNYTVGAMRILAKCISKTSKANELDAWDFREGYEAWTRDIIKRLRDSSAPLSVRQVESLYKAKVKQLADAKKREKFAGLTADEIASVESAEKNASLQTKLTELATRALDVQKYAADELKKGGADLKEFLANRGIIPAEKFVTAAEYAAQMTPGDAKALVQALITLYPTKPDRMQVFKVLHNTCKAVVSQIQSAAAQESKPAKVA
jgi:hypothetical protein